VARQAIIEPVVSTGTFFGVCPGNGVSNAQTKWGTPLGLRVFEGQVTNEPVPSRPSAALCPHFHWSVKPLPLTKRVSDAWIIAIANQLRDGDFVSVWHEADVKHKGDGNTSDLNNRMAMQTAFHNSVKRLRDAGTIKQIETVCVLGGWQFSSAGRNYAMYLTDADVLGVDLDGTPPPADPDDYYDWANSTVIGLINSAKMTHTYNGRVCIPEYAWAKSPADNGERIAMINEVTPKLIAQLNPETIMWFDFNNPDIPGEPLTTTAEINTWKNYIFA
jgi:hypothetical protein